MLSPAVQKSAEPPTSTGEDSASASGLPAPPAARSWSLAALRLRLLGIPLDEASPVKRGFAPAPAAAVARLRSIGETFITGYLHALHDPRPEAIERLLNRIAREDRGFAAEGAAMAAALLDLALPFGRGRFESLLASSAGAHRYMLHVGAGWAVARVPFLGRRLLARLDPLLRWLAFDGWGFHDGYFHAGDAVRARKRPRRLSGYAGRAFDQGLGRSLWFLAGTDVRGIQAAIEAFEEPRRDDLWSGVGLAAAYAGGVDEGALRALRAAAGGRVAHVAQGAAFAAKARQRAANPAAHTEAACRILCGRGADGAAAVTDRMLEGCRDEGRDPAFEVWRRRIRHELAGDPAP